MNKILVIHGPNLNMLGTREPEIYGSTTMQDINAMLAEQAENEGIETEFYQSNYEGGLIDKIQQSGESGIDFIILNAGAFTHYSIALRDAIASVNVPVIEVHISNVHTREEFRHRSVIAPVVMGQILGFGVDSYSAAMFAAIRKIKAGHKKQGRDMQCTRKD